MKAMSSNRGTGAFTLVELLVVIAIIGILAALLLPVLGQAKARAKRVQCVNNLKETGVAFYLFAHDHQGKFTTQISTNDGGAQEFVAMAYRATAPYYFAHQLFRPLANDMVTPKPFACPADVERWPATNFNQFNNWNLSYVSGLKTDPGVPGAILAGDRDFPACPAPGLWEILRVPCPVEWKHWGTALHEQKGNMLFSDGHVEESYRAIIAGEETVDEDLMYPAVASSAIAGDQSAPTAPVASATTAIPDASYSNNVPAGSSPPATSRVAATASPGVSKKSPDSGPVAKNILSGGSQLHFPQQMTSQQIFPEPAPTNPAAAREILRNVVPTTAVTVSNEPTYPQQLAVAARESLDATQWLWWLLLLLLLLILLARWLDRRWQRRKMLRRLRE